MNLKSHYKIIISIIIVIILLSSLIIYFYPHNNTYYYNNGKSIDVKYFNGNNYNDYHIKNEYYFASSYFINNNKISYLNSTLINPYYEYGSGNHYFGYNLTINLKNIDNNYIYITTSGDKNNQYIETNVLTNINAKCYYNNGNDVIRINRNDNLTNITFEISSLNLYINNNYYNFTIKVSSGKLYNTFYINLMRESAIYGCVLNEDEPVNNYNNTVYIENMNNSKINTINIVNDYYYYFVKPYTQYKIYSLNNNTLKLIYTLNNTLISTGNSINININESDLS